MREFALGFAFVMLIGSIVRCYLESPPKAKIEPLPKVQEPVRMYGSVESASQAYLAGWK